MQLLNIILLSILLPALSISGISIQDSGRNYVSESVVSVLGVASASQVAAQPYRFNAKEDQSFTCVPLLDYGARFYNPTLARWTTPDPLAEKYYSISPYAFCGNNPIKYVDPDGNDWYSYVETNATSQEELEDSCVTGTYLGQAVVIFEGAMDETLDEMGKLTGENAKPATVTIGGINGPDDVSSYLGLSVSSDPCQYSMIQTGENKL